MKLKTIRIFYLIIFILSIIFLTFLTFNFEQKSFICHINNNIKNIDKKSYKKWAIILTTAVDLKNKDERKKLYTKQIERWLNETDLDLFVIESTNTGFSDILPHPRLKIIIKDISKDQSSSQSESQSLLQALEEIPKEYNYIFKVTGRYFLKDFDSVLKDLPDADIYLQKHCNDILSFQNSEYFGMERNLLIEMLKRIEKIGMMEINIYQFIKDNNLKFYRLEPFFNDVRRGGDNALLNPL